VRLSIHRYLAIAGVLGTVLAFGCRATTTIWSAESISPDGNWQATAHTEQTSGPGNAWIETRVSLKRTHVSESPREILSFNNESVWPNGVTNVEMRWVTPSHLEVGYKGHASLDWQVVKFAGLDISVRNLSIDSTKGAR
jgi:hypothetical protein